MQYIDAADLQQAAAPVEDLTTATTTQMYKCPICDHLEFLEANIVAHIKQAHVMQQEQQQVQQQHQSVQYRCELCDTLHPSLSQLGQHQQEQHGLFPGAQDDEEREDVLRIIQVLLHYLRHLNVTNY